MGGVYPEMQHEELHLITYSHDYKVKEVVVYANGWVDLMLEIAEDVYNPFGNGEPYSIYYKEYHGWPAKQPHKPTDILEERYWFVYTYGYENELGYRAQSEIDEMVGSKRAIVMTDPGQIRVFWEKTDHFKNLPLHEV